MFDIKQVKEDAVKEVAKERADKAKTALVRALRERQAALDVLANVDRRIADLEASIADGSFAG